jgi:hypothetical protein
MSSQDNGAKSSRATADAPFGDASQADLVIRTSDGVDFYVYKFLLSLVSSVFNDMFSLPEPSSPEEKAQLPFIDVSETREVVRNLLRFIDPRLPDCDTLSLKQITDIIYTVDKYQMDCLEGRVVAQLKVFTTSEPLKVYQLAASMAPQRRWATQLAHAAADQLLRSPISNIMEIGNFNVHATSAHILRLTRYHALCGQIAKESVTNLSWLADQNSPAYWKFPRHCFCVATSESAPLVSISGSRNLYRPEGVPHWIDDYRNLLADALVREPLGTFLSSEIKPFIMSAKNRPCMKAMVQGKEGYAWVEHFNAALIARIEDGVKKVCIIVYCRPPNLT